MATYKRRIVYLSDEDWAEAGKQAKRHSMTVSALIRTLIVGGRIIPPAVQDEADRIDAAPNPYRSLLGTLPTDAKQRQAARDDILRRINRAGKA